MLVDDNATNLQVLYQTLRDPGLRVLIARDGDTALAIASKAAPDLVLLDIMMPGMDGFEVCRLPRAAVPAAGQYARDEPVPVCLALPAVSG